jgi:hypothetical protein
LECFFDGTDGENGKCKSTPRECRNSDHYYVSDTEKKCVEIEICKDRRPNSSDIRPCGSGKCYLDKNSGGTCKSECTFSDHYEGNSDNGVCELKDCDSRTGNLSETRPCGENCNYDMNDINDENGNECKTTCSNDGVYEGINGICVLKTCTSRIPTSGAIESNFPCGYDSNCVLDGNDCKSRCSDTINYENINGKCILK